MRSFPWQPLSFWISSSSKRYQKHAYSLSRFSSHVLSAIGQFTRRQSTVRRKITLGYALAVSIPAVGASTGLAVGNRYQARAMDALAITYEEQTQLRELNTAILRTRIAQELGPYVDDPSGFIYSVDVIRDRIISIKHLADQLESAQTQSIQNFAPELRTYQKTLDGFSREIYLLMQDSLASPRSIPRLEQRVLLIAKSDNFRKFTQLSEEIDLVALDLSQDIETAQRELKQAERLRSQIVVISLLSSVVVAGCLALMTSKTISSPLESLTDVARTVVEQEDIKIRASVSTHDEIGTLAVSLNQLIEWVQTYTDELEAAQLQLIQTEKMSSVGQLVAGIAHEINNPVNFIHGNINPVSRYATDLLNVLRVYQTHYLDPPEEIKDLLEEVDVDFIERDFDSLLKSMSEGTTRIKDIVLSLRNFSRLDESDYKTVDLHEGISNTLLLLQHRLKAHNATDSTAQNEITVVESYAALPNVECLPGAVNQVIMHLVTNAIDALEGAEDSISQRREIEVATQTVGSDRVQISVSDTGGGMTAAVRSRIFDPFFTTKPIGKGTGLGLSISYQIITQQHRGRLTCTSTVGKGTQFVIELPVQHNQARMVV